MGVTLNCEYCGKPFTPINLTKKYCSDSCNRKASYERNKEYRRKKARENYHKKVKKNV